MNSTTIYNVTQINNKINYLFERKLNNIFIRGEISSFTLYDSGHAYFTLKDNSSIINCVYFNYFHHKEKLKLRENIEVVGYGNISIYKTRGAMQFVVSNIHIGNEGLLWQKYLKLKKTLEKEGLFDSHYKQELPEIPEKITLISSKNGAVIHDMLTILYRRAPYLNIAIKDSLVQGNKAVESITDIIKNINKKKDTDLIIIARGGGSLEDIMPFNNEVLVREIFNSSIPIITAIGHETDFTLSDFVSDKRAATPSEAAEICAPDISFIDNRIKDYRKTIKSTINNLLQKKKSIFNTYYLRILLKNPKLNIESYNDKLVFSYKLLIKNINERLKYFRYSINQYKNKLENFNVEHIKDRGFFMIRKKGAILTSIKDFQIDDKINIESHDGVIGANVNKINVKATKK